MTTKPYPRVNGLKTIPFSAAHTHIANIWEYPLAPEATCAQIAQVKERQRGFESGLCANGSTVFIYHIYNIAYENEYNKFKKVEGKGFTTLGGLI